ncbi:hypothetical protein [Enemella evansiae]|uniref:Uncharacterized protein n=1 Tax=Enemella evansiae TaxID=2016499 RepID=A0A255GNS4_9ACTN|nr:hypothetical protein [Enemella evansiae]PFG69184.1 hypothetical protein B0O41_4037 [Propionibacteriaceae bacterium ES.041]OYO00816.1 hypothetical protein CGZ95_09380 [Enemella evansiae]OYO12083.1 hypothetical protein CGZ98_07815 [Enemella evansiae]OYO17467.1 hypothetical protein CGZ94_00720 [Enemella evansiae]TDO89471.1 hypothetical protein C8D81_2343 [Enemella evansiae]
MAIIFSHTVDDLLRARVAQMASAVDCGAMAPDEAVDQIAAAGLLGRPVGAGLQRSADTVAALAEECPTTAYAVLRSLGAEGIAADVLELSWYAGLIRGGLADAETVVDRGTHERYRVEVDELRAESYSLLGGWQRWACNTMAGSISELWVLLGAARLLARRAGELAVELDGRPAARRRLAAVSAPVSFALAG